MKYLKLFTWLLAPLIMIILAYLFLLPPEQSAEDTSGNIALVILDPVDLDTFDNHASLCPEFHELRRKGLIGHITESEANIIQDAILEMLTGKTLTNLATGSLQFNAQTYELSYRNIEKMALMTLPEILAQFGKAQKNRLRIIRIEMDNLSPAKYVEKIDRILMANISQIDTWFVTCPLQYPTENPTAETNWDINKWLIDNNYLALDDNGTINFAETRVFHAGGCEPGLRINRELTYSKGIVPRDEYSRLRRELAKKLRPVCGKIYTGERIYPNRTEGQYPDIVWELHENVRVVTNLSPAKTPDHPGNLSPLISCLKPGGWILFNGPVFDSQLRDMSRLDNLMTADLAPTILYLLRLPVAKDMDGRVLRPVMNSDQHRRMPEYVETYSMNDPLVEQNFNE